MSLSPRARADLALIAVSAIWGSTFVLVKSALADLSTGVFLALRFAIAAAALWLVFRARGKTRIQHTAAARKAGFIVGLCLFSGYVLQTIGLRYTTPAKAGFITGFYIVLTPLLGAAIYRRIPTGPEIAGVIMATAGMGLLTLKSAGLDMAPGDLLVSGCAIAFALHIIALGHYSERFDYETLSLYQIVACALLGAVSFWWLEPLRFAWSGPAVAAIAVTAILATAFAFAVQSWAQQFTTPTRTALIFSAEPVFAWLTSFILEKEVLSNRAAIGAVLILAGILTVELKPTRSGSHPS
jgi:drug/metabolite transporter (DMT)-like permease